jgi:hypothetical protein
MQKVDVHIVCIEYGREPKSRSVYMYWNTRLYLTEDWSSADQVEVVKAFLKSKGHSTTCTWEVVDGLTERHNETNSL